MKAAELLGFGFALVVGWTDPEGARPRLGALLLAYYDPDGKLVYAGRVGTGIKDAELERLWRRLQPLATPKMPLNAPPPRTNRFGSPLVLSRVHWVRPELVAEVKFLAWIDDNLLRQVIYEGLREDKEPRDVRREAPSKSWLIDPQNERMSQLAMRYEEIMVNDKLVAQKCEFFVYLSEFPWQIELKERHETLG